MYKKVISLLSVTLCLSAQDIVGTWTLTNKERPFKFSSAVSYEMKFQFNKDGILQSIQNSGNVLGTTRHYELHGDKLKVALKNKNTLNNIGLNLFSSQTLTLTKINSQCFQAKDEDDKNNAFVMCKIK